MNSPALPDIVRVLWPETNIRGFKVTTQVRDPAYNDNEWHDLVYEVLNPHTVLTTKQVNPSQRIVIEVI